jgi:hypothetical protein
MQRDFNVTINPEKNGAISMYFPEAFFRHLCELAETDEKQLLMYAKTLFKPIDSNGTKISVPR